MKIERKFALPASYGFVAMLVAGCASTPEPTGFLSDYSRLEKTGDARMGYVSPKLAEYDAFMIDPVEYRLDSEKPVLTDEQKAEVANYFRTTFERTLREKNYKIVTTSGPRVVRFRAAFTDVQKSKWYMNLHYATKMAGAGAGGASIEAEAIDSVTGEQLGGVIAAGKGNQFELDHFKAFDDVEDVIDKWAKILASRLDELRDEARQ